MIVNARMYSATPQAKAAWKRVLAWVIEKAGLEWELLDYDAPAPLSDLWARDDLGAAMMCGLPYSQRRPRPKIVAAPVPSPARYGGRPIYFTDIVVRSDAKYSKLEDTFGAVVGYTLEDSMSGCIALRYHLLQYGNRSPFSLYRKAVGGLIHGRRVIEALVAGTIDVGPLDSYYHDLLIRNDPATAARVRIVATTASAPIPPLVATGAVSGAELGRLRSALLAVHDAGELQAERETLLLSRFAVPEPSDYDVLDDILRETQ
jgi:ABC-type phosphate/phosphonate transport system substrate-binding protein